MMDYKLLIILLFALIIIIQNYEQMCYLIKRFGYPASKKKLQSNVNIEMLNPVKKHIDAIIHDDIIQNYDGKMREMCEYVLDGGKRVRSIIVMATYDSLKSKSKSKSKIINYNVYKECINDICMSLEYIHAASLIFDDIMDNDYYRRGKTCLHIVEGIGNAQMVAIELLSLSLLKFNDCLRKMVKFNNGSKECVITMHDLLGKNIKKLSDGQYIDITNKFEIIDDKNIGIKIKNSEITNVINLKTGSLFELSFILPFLIVNSSDEFNGEMTNKMNKFMEIGQVFGLLFQISDDFEDYDEDIASDGKNSVMNYVIVHGPEKSINDYCANEKNLKNMLNEQNIDSMEINLIMEYLKDKCTNYHNLINI